MTDILIVEDSATQAAQIKYLLESHNYKVFVTQNGHQALAWLSEHMASLVISDIVMPEMNGYELCGKIRKDKRIENIPVILLTSLTDPGEVIEGLSCGADIFITKPYNKDYLISNIEKILEEKVFPVNADDTLSIEIKYDGEKRMIRIGPQKMFNLLLNIYQGAIFKNNELIQTQEELSLVNEHLETLVEERTSALSNEIKASKEVTNQLKDSEEKFRSAMENSADAIFISDQQGKYMFTNKAVTDMLGYTAEEMACMAISDLSPENTADEHSKIFLQVLSSGKIFTEVELLTKYGNSIIVDLSSVLLPGGLVYESCRDITKRKLSEEALKYAKEKAEASDNLKTTFLNNISHEVRTPLNGILGFAEIFLQPGLSEEDKKLSLSMLFESSDRLLNTITDYMDISLITSGNMSVCKKDFVPEQVLRDAFDKYKTICSDKGLKLFLKIPEQNGNISINSDREVFQKILYHLLDNAIKFTKKGNINFGYIVHEGGLEFFVKDTGIGIDSESLENIFDRFVKEDQGPGKFSDGSGLGLSIAQGLAEVIGGHIRVESEMGAGSCFCFTIPFEQNTEEFPSGVSGKKHRKKDGKNTILVAEDDDANFVYLQTLLKKNSSAIVIHASTGKEALDLFKQNPDISVILMDVKMPIMNGLEATRQIRAIDRNVPIIAVTAYAMPGDQERILGAGCDHYLTKPIDRKLLFDKVSEYITLKI